MLKDKRKINLRNNKLSNGKQIGQEQVGSNQESENKNKQGISTFKIAATYIGVIVGAGFASGQEVLQFFGYYGIRGFFGLLITTFFFVFFGYVILKLGQDYRASSHLQVIRHAGGKWLGLLIDLVVTFFLFGALTAMIAGSGAIFEEQFGFNKLWGNILMTGATLATTLLGISGVISAISMVVPLLLTGVFSVTILTVINNLPLTLSKLSVAIPGRAAVPNWGLSALVYTSFNLVLAVAVLAPMGAEVGERKSLKKGSILGGIGLGVGAMAILLGLLLNMPGASGYEIPMVYIAGQFSPWFQLVYSGILLAEIYTTAVGNLYGFAVRLSPSTGKQEEGKQTTGKRYYLVIILTSIFALIASQFGFTNLVHYLYPAVGYAGILMLAGLTVGIIRESIR